MRLLAALALAALMLTGCHKDPYNAYCGTVKEHQEALTRAVDEQGLLAGLDTFEELEVKAPEDIRDDWKTVVAALAGLRGALDDAGIDPSSYDPASPPPGLTPEQQQAVATAADKLAGDTTKQALAAVEQQARDVCHTPLTL